MAGKFLGGAPSSIFHPRPCRGTLSNNLWNASYSWGDDLIVSFAIENTEPEEPKSLILLRTPKYESVFEDHERGVSVSYDEQPDSEADEDLLIRISIVQNMVTVVSKYHRYELDVSSVDREKLADACKVLRQMNFDNRFTLEIS